MLNCVLKHVLSTQERTIIQNTKSNNQVGHNLKMCKKFCWNSISNKAYTITNYLTINRVT